MARETNESPTDKNLTSLFHLVLKNVKGSKRKKLLLVTASVLALTSFTFISKFGSQLSSRRDLTDYTVAAETGSLPGLITASGELQAQRSVNVSPDKQGILEIIYVEEGDKVQKGQILARMESGDFEFRLAELKAEYEKTKSSYDRRNRLFDEGAISAEENDDYKNRYLTSKARLQQREVEGRELLIRAPFNGFITARYAEPGAFVTPTTRASSSAGATSTSVLELSQGMEIAAKVPESDIGRIKIGQKASVRVDAFPDQRFSSTVKEIAPRAVKTDNVTSFEVKLLFDQVITKLRIGMTVDVDFKTGSTAQRTLVPTVAIVTENGKPGLLTVGRNNQPDFQPIELGTSSGSKTAILNGIEPGQLVFIDLPPWAKKKRN